MSLKVDYTPLMLRRVAEVRADVEASRPGGKPSKTHDEVYCQSRYRLSFDYIKNVGTKFQRPSLRVLKNLGLELWVRNPRTGEEEKISMDSVVDWSPRHANS